MSSIIILKSNDSSEIRNTNSNAIQAISSILSTCLGPKAFQKLILTKMNSLEITNDGNSILRELDIAHPAAKTLIEIARTQDETVGDGTTSVILLASQMFANLIELGHHPILMSNSLQKILNFILSKVGEIEIKIEEEAQIIEIVKQSVATKLCVMLNVDIPNLAFKTAKICENLADMRIEKLLDVNYKDSYVLDGIALNKNLYHPQMRTKIENPKVLIVENGIEYTKGASQTDMEFSGKDDFERAHLIEEEVVMEMVSHILELKPDIVVCEKGISDMALSVFAQNNITAIRRLRKSESFRLSRCTHAKVVTRAIDALKEDLGTCGVFEYKKVGEEDYCFFDKCKNTKACTVFIKGPSKDLLNEFERNFYDALKVSKNLLAKNTLVPGGGAFEMFVCNILKNFNGTEIEKDVARKISAAFKIIPEALAKNCGVNDAISLISMLEIENNENKFLGINGVSGKIENMKDVILESSTVKEQSIKSSIEAVGLLLRVDGIIRAKN